MAEPTERFSIVTAGLKDEPSGRRREYVRLGKVWGSDEDDGTPYVRELFSWSQLVDPEPYTPPESTQRGTP
jgi:hypothetical protein